MSCEPWQCAEIAATKKANPIQKPEIAVAMIKKASPSHFLLWEATPLKGTWKANN